MDRSVFYLIFLALLWGESLQARSNHTLEKIRNSQLKEGNKDRPENKTWNMHAAVASMLDRLSPKIDTGEERGFDGFEANLASLRIRAKNLASDFNDAEVAALDTEAARLENAQKILLSRFEALKEDTKSTANQEQKDNLQKLIQIFQIRLKEARKVKSVIKNLSKNQIQEWGKK